jgi:hypothetical protein
MVQYHGLGLLYQIRKTDRLGVTKLVAKLTKMPLKSPYAACHLVNLQLLLTQKLLCLNVFFFMKFRFAWFVSLSRKKKQVEAVMWRVSWTT